MQEPQETWWNLRTRDLARAAEKGLSNRDAMVRPQATHQSERISGAGRSVVLAQILPSEAYMYGVRFDTMAGGSNA